MALAVTQARIVLRDQSAKSVAESRRARPGALGYACCGYACCGRDRSFRVGVDIGGTCAGASPGPACYARGGVEPTVTDAYLVAGILNPDSFLGGTLTLQPELSHQALARLGEPIGLDAAEAADAVLRVTTSMLYAELLPELARRGADIRDFALLAYGGAGPTHTFMAARELPIRRVIVPTTPGTMCALAAWSLTCGLTLWQPSGGIAPT
ncbi:MAG: hypothetical protein LC797_21045 [Chloroflexi bacterium]|nr:hypothetical protein [Chloroflexota bacterium]